MGFLKNILSFHGAFCKIAPMFVEFLDICRIVPVARNPTLLCLDLFIYLFYVVALLILSLYSGSDHLSTPFLKKTIRQTLKPSCLLGLRHLKKIVRQIRHDFIRHEQMF